LHFIGIVPPDFGPVSGQRLDVRARRFAYHGMIPFQLNYQPITWLNSEFPADFRGEDELGF
jgi:hypothetical protein